MTKESEVETDDTNNSEPDNADNDEVAAEAPEENLPKEAPPPAAQPVEQSHSSPSTTNLTALVRSKTPDQVSGRFTLRLGEMLPHYSNDFCTAYDVTDITHKEDGKYYAIVLDKNIPARLGVIAALRKLTPQNVSYPINAEVTLISTLNEQRITMILAKPDGISLREYISTHGPCSEQFISQQIITPFNALLRNIHDFDITHGNINLDTVMIDEHQRITLAECVSQPCGYSQIFLYESLDRATLLPISKGEAEPWVDYFALGALCLSLIIGKEPIAPEEAESCLEARLSKGSFNALGGNYKIPAVMEDLLKGLINDKKGDCWNYRQLTEWIKGKRFNIIAPTSHIESSRPVFFNGKEFFNCRALVYELYKHWEMARRLVKDDTILKWVERGIKDNSKATRLQAILRTQSYNNKSTLPEDDLVAHTLLTLDPDGIFRFKDIATNIDGVGTLLAYGVAKTKKEYVQAFTKILKTDLCNVWSSGNRNDNKNKNQFNALWLLERAQQLLEENSIGFGLERCLYEMNPALPCQSNLLFGEYIASLPDLIYNLEEHAAKRTLVFVDRHIAAFITSRLEMKNRVSIAGLSKYPKLESHSELRTLSLLALAQRETKIKRLRNIATMLETRLIPVINLYSSKTIREEITSKLHSLAKTGDLVAILKLMTNTMYIKQDANGFKEASAEYLALEQKILQFENRRIIADSGKKLGLQFALMIAYLSCAIVVMVLLKKANY